MYSDKYYALRDDFNLAVRMCDVAEQAHIRNVQTGDIEAQPRSKAELTAAQDLVNELEWDVRREKHRSRHCA